MAEGGAADIPCNKAQGSSEHNARGYTIVDVGGGGPARFEFKFSAHIAMLGTFEHIEVLIPATGHSLDG